MKGLPVSSGNIHHLCCHLLPESHTPFVMNLYDFFFVLKCRYKVSRMLPPREKNKIFVKMLKQKVRAVDEIKVEC